jgi:hypothetical protein
MADVRLFKLLSGEYVVSAFTYQEAAKTFTFTDPAQISMQQGENGQMQVGLVDFLPFTEENQKIAILKESHIVYDHSPSIALLNAYSKLYGSGLILPGEQAIARPTGGPSGLRLV